jgi:NACHT domain
MFLLPTIVVPAAVATVARAAWLYARNAHRRSAPETEKLRRRAFSWILQAAVHFVGRHAKRTWVLRYALDRYLMSLYARHEKLSIPGRIELPIDRCYIPLELRSGQMTEAIQVLSRSGATLILGDPGTGKSALLSWIIRNLCTECRENRETARLPVYVPLHQLVSYLPSEMNRDLRPDEAVKALEAWFGDYEATPIDLYESNNMISSLAQTTKHGIVVLLDGLDEIDTDSLGHVESFLLALIQFMDTAPGQNLVLITSRRQALDFTPRLATSDSSKSIIVELRPFSPAAIYSFLLRWPYRHMQHPAKEASRIFGQLKLNATLLDTCSNPLALTLYVDHDLRLKELGYAEAGLQPDTRAAFFTDIVDYLMVRRRSAQLNKATPTRPFRQARIDFFIAVVDEHIRSRDQFGTISNEITLKHATNLARQGQTSEEALSDLAKDTGIIQRDRGGTWRFIHESFLNYFLACSMANVSRSRDLAQLFRHLQVEPLKYLEGFYLACGLMASRSSPYLATMLSELGRNTFVGRYYPRAMLESQSYFRPGFVERMKFWCGFWKSHTDDITLFRDLVAVLIDYERACSSLGRMPEISAFGQFRNELGSAQNSVLQVAMLDIDVAMKIANDDSMTEILTRSSPEDAIVALYDPGVAERLQDSEVDSNQRLAAVVAEAALRSSLFVATLVQPRNRAPFLYPDQPWADSWPIRGSRFAYILSLALPYVKSLTAEKQADYPHLRLLAYVRPIRRLRYELLFGDWRMSIFLLGLLVTAISPLWLLGATFEVIAFAALASFLIILTVFRQAVLHGVITPASLRMLNMQPIETRGLAYSERTTRLVAGDRASLHRWRMRTPHGSDGMLTAAYTHDLPFIWRRFCPQLGDQRISRIGCASIQQLWTEDVRRLIRG